MYFTYVLKSLVDNKHYIGSTDSVEERLKRHNGGRVKSTANRRPFELITYFGFQSKQRAQDLERYLKRGSGRAFLKKRVF